MSNALINYHLLKWTPVQPKSSLIPRSLLGTRLRGLEAVP